MNNLNEFTNNVDPINLDRIYKLPVSYKKYNVFQKFWGKEYLPKTRVALFPSQLLYQISNYIDSDRAECRKHRAIIIETAYIEIQADLTRIPIELCSITCDETFCIELKPKFGILFGNHSNKSSSCNGIRSRATRFCLHQLLKNETRRTSYCPADLFSGHKSRMRRAIKALIDVSDDKLRVFQDGELIDQLNGAFINQMMSQLCGSDINNIENSNDLFASLIIQSLTHDLTEKYDLLNLLTTKSNLHTNCQIHSCSSDKSIITNGNMTAGDCELGTIYRGSVLGRLMTTSCLETCSIDEIKKKYDTLVQYLQSNCIAEKSSIFDLCTESLLTMDVPTHIRNIIKQIKKFIICLTVRDSSILIRFRKLTNNIETDLLKYNDLNSFILPFNRDLRLLCMVNVIDITLKPLSKIDYNYFLEQKIVNSASIG